MKKGLLIGVPLLFFIAFIILVFLVIFTMGFFFDFGVHDDEKPESLGIGICSLTGVLDEIAWDEGFSNAGVLTDKANKFIEEADKQGIDPVLFAAISFHETGWGKSDAVKNYNNPGGLMKPDGSGLYRFDTLDEGIESMGNTLHNRIIIDGLVTIDDLGSLYAPIGADNDPSGLNENWVPITKQIVEYLGGLTMNCDKQNEIEIIDKQAWIVPYTKNITSTFGIRWGRSHKGIDVSIGGIHGKPFVAFREGTVIASGLNGTVYGGLEQGKGYGYYVLIDHGDGMKTRYAHMARPGIPAGAKVKAGQQIGVVGTTGHSSGPHLHFEILVHDTAVDPLLYLQDFDLFIPPILY